MTRLGREAYGRLDRNLFVPRRYKAEVKWLMKALVSPTMSFGIKPKLIDCKGQALPAMDHNLFI